jgi:NADPH:quinone reductase-like Zn-dependent oxidoreductase
VFALQLAKLVGARVIVTSSSEAKLERARSLGADETIDYTKTPDWEKRVRELTGGEGADHVLEVGYRLGFSGEQDRQFMTMPCVEDD